MVVLVAAVAGASTPQAKADSFPTPVYAEEAYLRNEVIRKLRTARFQADVPDKERVTVVRLVIARAGRLLDAQVIRSSGETEIDHNILAALQQASPYAPLPPAIPGESARFRLPLAAVPRP